ncbi:MAG: protease modulator HflC [Alphaproteobacteria bacterium]|nr:protease modulator HflC [Alphaproteobacteria bacterium]
MNKVFLIILGVVVIVLGVIGFDAFYTVHQTQQALVLQFGRPILVEREPGLKIKLPLLQDVEYFDRRILNLDPPAQEVILADQKRINVNAFVRFRILDPLEFKKRANTTANFIQLFGNRLNSAVRAEVGTVLLGDMLSGKRNDIMRRITAQLKGTAPEFGIEVVDVRIGRTDLPETTSQSVYNRMRSERLAQASQLRAEGAEIKARIQAEADRERTIIIAEAQRESQILRGEGEGRRTTILNNAFGQDPEFFSFYRSMEAYDNALGAGTTMVLSPNSEFFRYFRDVQGDDLTQPVN